MESSKRSKWYKFYVVLFNNHHYTVPDDKVLVKYGITHHMNVEDRFNPQVDDGYSKNYKDWSIKVLFSLPCRSKEDAEYLEKLYLEKRFPYKSKYKVWVEDLFGLEDRNYYYDNTGVTELRLLTVEEKNKTLNELFLLKRKLGGKVFTVEKESV